MARRAKGVQVLNYGRARKFEPVLKYLPEHHKWTMVLDHAGPASWHWLGLGSYFDYKTKHYRMAPSDRRNVRSTDLPPDSVPNVPGFSS